jgi:hypothetical protein
MAGYTAVNMDSKTEAYDSTHELHNYKANPASSSKDGREPAGAAWNPGFWRRFPIWAAISILLSITMAGCMGLVLALANGKLANWKVSPTVILAATAAIANAMGRYALVEGVAISCKSYNNMTSDLG